MGRHLVFAALCMTLVATEASAAGMLRPRDGSPPIGVKSHRVTAVIEDGLARTTLRQTFVNPGDRMLEAVYTFPLPDGAALVDVAMEVGGQRLEGLLVERRQARQIYDSIVRRRRDPALVEQTGRSEFRLSVFPVMPKQDTVVELTWIERVSLSQGAFRYVYPLFLAEGGARTEEDFTFVLTVRSSAPLAAVTSPMKDMAVVRKGPGGAIASFERTGAPLDQDVVVTARVESELPALAVKTFRRPGEDGYFLAVLTPPKAREAELIPRDVILVVDTSGSMEGRKIEQAKAAALYLLKNLRPVDRVNVIRFSSAVQAFAEAPRPATKKACDELTEFVLSFGAGGGTALGDALETAVAVPPKAGRVRTVVFLTDGLPTVGEQDPAKIVGFAREGGDRGLRVFTFGVGADVNPTLLEGIASAGRGDAEVFRPESEIASRLRRFLDRTASPVLADISLEVEGLATYDLFPRPIPDAYLGEQVTILGRYRDGGEHAMRVRAVLGDREAVIADTVDFRKTPGGPESVMQLFAREKLDYLQSALRLRSGLSDDAYYASLDRGAYSTADEIVAEIVNQSLATGVQSAYTAFLVLLPEDRHRVNPRDLAALNAALDRARVARAKAAGIDVGDVTVNAADAKDAPPDQAQPEKPRTRAPVSSSGSAPQFFGGSHGGAYRGPAGEVPPDQRDPTDPQPRPAPSAPGGIATPAGGRRAAPARMTFENWLFWWAYNKDRILAERGVRPPGPGEEVLRARIIPALDRVLRNPALHVDIRGAAVIARARCGRTGEIVPEFVKLAASQVEDRVFRESAVLAIALAGEKSPAIRDFLVGLAENRGEPTRLRCFAMVSLGLLGFDDDVVFEALVRVLDDDAVERDVPVCALLAIGLAGDARRVPDLLEWARTRRIGERTLSDLERAWVVDALGRIGDPGAAETVAGFLKGKHRLTKRSAAIALGRLVPRLEPGAQRAYFETLGRFHQKERDLAAKNFALIALGRIAAAPGVAETLRADIVAFLEREAWKKGNKVAERPFAAIALGLVGAAPGTPEEMRNECGELLREDLAKLKGDKVARGAAAVSLGLMGHESAVPLLLMILKDRGLEKKLRGAAAVALGLIGDRRADAPVLSALVERGDRDLRIQAATAAALLGTPGAEGLLVTVLEDPRSSQFVLGSAALALGRVGGKGSVESLLKIIEPDRANGSWPDLTRALAVVALGQIAAAGKPDALDRVTTDVNYRASVAALDELLTIL